MVIDPLEAVITWLRNSLTVVGGRVASKHRYGEGWTESQTGVSVHLDGGLPDLYAPVAMLRLEVRIYSDDQANVVSVWRDLVALSRTEKRFAVETSLGRALVQNFLPETSLSMLYDDVLKMDVGVVFFGSTIGEDAIL